MKQNDSEEELYLETPYEYKILIDQECAILDTTLGPEPEDIEHFLSFGASFKRQIQAQGTVLKIDMSFKILFLFVIQENQAG